ncbi:uncharacterized protein [Littorina saxatilis]|uniref:uncharacterized protein n=1 Tax=Littorina saxatilis TaxID=31220 RepID=UPI0038B4EBB1
MFQTRGNKPKHPTNTTNTNPTINTTPFTNNNKGTSYDTSQRWPSQQQPPQGQSQGQGQDQDQGQGQSRSWGCSRACSCTMEMFSMLKHSIYSDNVNPINSYFEVGRHVGSAGPEMVWKVFDAIRKEDKKDCSVFLFDKKIADKLHKPRRREIVSEVLRKDIWYLERMKHPHILNIMHGVEECHQTREITMTGKATATISTTVTRTGDRDFSETVQEKRRRLLPTQRDLRQRGYKATLSYDKLMTNEAVFVFDVPSGSVIRQERFRRRPTGPAQRRGTDPQPPSHSNPPCTLQTPPQHPTPSPTPSLPQPSPPRHRTEPPGTEPPGMQPTTKEFPKEFPPRQSSRMGGGHRAPPPDRMEPVQPHADGGQRSPVQRADGDPPYDSKRDPARDSPQHALSSHDFPALPHRPPQSPVASPSTSSADGFTPLWRDADHRGPLAGRGRGRGSPTTSSHPHDSGGRGGDLGGVPRARLDGGDGNTATAEPPGVKTRSRLQTGPTSGHGTKTQRQGRIDIMLGGGNGAPAPGTQGDPDPGTHRRDDVTTYLVELFNKLFRTGTYPAEWAKAIIHPIFKKGNDENPDNYRGVSLLSCESVTVPSWSNKVPKMAQPDLNFLSPEVQLGRNCCPLSDMFSLGMVVCSIYYAGQSLIAADHNPNLYVKQLDQMHDLFGVVAHKMPMDLVDPVEKMINKDVRYRPSAQLFCVLKYFSDPVTVSLHALACTDRRDPGGRADAYSNLSKVVPLIPRKVLYKSVLPTLLEDCKQADSVIYALPTLLTVIDFATRDDYCDNILTEFCAILTLPKPVQATVYILNRLDVILSKTPLEEIRSEILPMVFNCLDSSSLHAQEAAIGAIGVVKEYLDDNILRRMVLPKAKALFCRSTNVKMRINALSCMDHLLESLDKMLILDDVLPFLTDITCQDPDVVVAIVSIYKHMLSDKRFGLTHNLLATRVMPSLIPHTVNPGLTMEQFSALMEVLRDMLDQVDKQRRNKMKLETVTIPVPHRGSIKMQTGDDVTDLQALIDSRVFIQQPKSKPAPSTPELQQRPRVSSPKSQRKNHSLQSLGMSLDEKSTLDKPLDTQRRHSLIPPSNAGGTPTISITSEDAHSPASSRRPSTHSLGPFSTCVSGFTEYLSHQRGSICGSERSSRRPSTHSVGILPISMFGEGGERPRRPSTHSLGVFPISCFGDEGGKGDRPRRCSTHSLGPLVVPDMERRGSKGSLLTSLGFGEGGPPSNLKQRRPSFQELGESVMQYFSGK